MIQSIIYFILFDIQIFHLISKKFDIFRHTHAASEKTDENLVFRGSSVYIMYPLQTGRETSETGTKKCLR